MAGCSAALLSALFEGVNALPSHHTLQSACAQQTRASQTCWNIQTDSWAALRNWQIIHMHKVVKRNMKDEIIVLCWERSLVVLYLLLDFNIWACGHLWWLVPSYQWWKVTKWIYLKGALWSCLVNRQDLCLHWVDCVHFFPQKTFTKAIFGNLIFLLLCLLASRLPLLLCWHIGALCCLWTMKQSPWRESVAPQHK